MLGEVRRETESRLVPVFVCVVVLGGVNVFSTLSLMPTAVKVYCGGGGQWKECGWRVCEDGRVVRGKSKSHQTCLWGMIVLLNWWKQETSTLVTWVVL